jgi:phage terminase small subunit
MRTNGVRPAAAFGYYAALPPTLQLFVDEYLHDLNAPAAEARVRRKRFQGQNLGLLRSNLLDNPDIQRAIRERREMLVGGERMHNPRIGGQFVLSRLWDVATADPRELISVHRVPCRYCWGINGQYQFTKTEMDRVLRAHEYGRLRHPFNALWPRSGADQAAYIAGKAGLPFDPQGGDGYTTSRAPNDACSECAGGGITLEFIADTRHLSAEARQLYRGVKIGPGKIEVMMADQDHARDMLARHYGIAVEKKEVLVRALNPKDLNDDELLQAIDELERMTIESTDHETVAIAGPAPRLTAVQRKRLKSLRRPR